MVDPEVALQITRVVGQAMSRVAEAEVAAVRERLEALGLIDGRTDEEISAAVVTRSAALLPAIEGLLVYQWRRHLPAVAQRVVLAHGPVHGLEGDYFGPTVNLASRIVNIAYAGSVVVCAEIQTRLADDERFVLRAARPRRLKDIGLTPLWVVRRPDQPARRFPDAVVERMRARRGH